MAERTEWKSRLASRRIEHVRLTNEIDALETELNERIYRHFDLTLDEIRIIEQTTAYPYGEV